MSARAPIIHDGAAGSRIKIQARRADACLHLSADLGAGRAVQVGWNCIKSRAPPLPPPLPPLERGPSNLGSMQTRMTRLDRRPARAACANWTLRPSPGARPRAGCSGQRRNRICPPGAAPMSPAPSSGPRPRRVRRAGRVNWRPGGGGTKRCICASHRGPGAGCSYPLQLAAAAAATGHLCCAQPLARRARPTRLVGGRAGANKQTETKTRRRINLT